MEGRGGAVGAGGMGGCGGAFFAHGLGGVTAAEGRETRKLVLGCAGGSGALLWLQRVNGEGGQHPGG